MDMQGSRQLKNCVAYSRITGLSLDKSTTSWIMKLKQNAWNVSNQSMNSWEVFYLRMMIKSLMVCTVLSQKCRKQSKIILGKQWKKRLLLPLKVDQVEPKWENVHKKAKNFLSKFLKSETKKVKANNRCLNSQWKE